MHYATRPNLPDLGIGDSIVAPTATKGCRHVWNQYTVRVKNGRRDALAEAPGRQENWLGDLLSGAAPLAEVLCDRSGYEPGSLRKTEQACREVLSLPVYPGTDCGRARRGDRRRCGVLRRTRPRGGVDSQERSSPELGSNGQSYS